jgi:hypothetical protein
VIVKLAVRDLGPETWVDSDIMSGLRRVQISGQRNALRSILFNVPHRVNREFEDFPFVALEATSETLKVLEFLSGIVTDVFEDQFHRPFLGQSGPIIEADQVWGGGFAGVPYDGTGKVIAILDTGVDRNHPFLRKPDNPSVSKVVEEACFSSSFPASGISNICPGGKDSTAAGSAAPCNVPGDCDHGTHVAGIAAGHGRNGDAAPFSGVARGADIMAIQVFSRGDDLLACFPFSPPCIGAFTSDVIAGLQRVYSRRTALSFAAVNLSLGAGGFTQTCDNNPIKRVIDSLRAAHIATVIASGNDGFTNALSSPACVSTAVSVGSTGDGSGATSLDSVSSFSNYATFLSLLAPGDLITSSVPGGVFDSFEGTSMAAPQVAGVFALLKQAAPSATVSQLLSILQNTGAPVTHVGITKSRVRALSALNALPVVQFDSAAYSVDESQGVATIGLTRTGALNAVSTVRYATSNGTASAPADYTTRSGVVTFNPGDTNKAFTVPVINDTLDEGDETIHLTLSDATGGTILLSTAAQLTIVDDDTAGEVQLEQAAYSVAEGTPTATIIVTRSGGAASGVAVSYATGNGSATAGSDYVAKTGTLVFAAGETSKSFTVSIINDTLDESDETVNLTLSNPTGGATLGAHNTAVLTITDNDVGGTVQFITPTYTVGEMKAAVITVTRSGGTASGVTVDYATSNGTAVAGSDYTATSGTLTFAAGQTSRTFSVPIIGDTLDEANETVNLTLSNPGGGATLGAQGSAVLTITDNDSGGSVQFSVANYSGSEAKPAIVTVTRSGGAASGVTVDYATSDGTAVAGADYAAAAGTLSFAAGQTSRTFTVPIINDTLDDGNRTVLLTLSNPTGGAMLGLRSSAVLNIVDNDAAGTVQFSVAGYNVSEANANATITVTRAGGLASGATVDYASAGGTAEAGADYTATSGTLSFAAGQTSTTFSIPLLDDGLAEGNETVDLTLSNPTGGAVLGLRSSAVLTILDDEISIHFSSANFIASERGKGIVTVVRSGPAGPSVTVDYSVTDGTATANLDYTAQSGTLVFGPGQTIRSFVIPIINDGVDEPNETINLLLQNPGGGAQLGPQNSAVLTIIDNDPGGTL